MKIRPTALLLGGVVGVALATAAIAGADPSAGPSLGDPWVFTTWPEPSDSVQTSYDVTQSGLFSQTSQSTMHYTNVADGGNEVIGEYDTSNTTQQQFGIFHASYVDSEEVTDSSGVGPPVGTEWDSNDFYLQFMAGPVNLFQLPIFSYESIDIPDGMSGSFITFFNSMGNEFVSGPDGMADYMYVAGDFIPLFDTLPD